MRENEHEKLQRLVESAELAPLLPVLCAIWADGELGVAETAAVRAGADWVHSESARTALTAWLRPDDPPTPTQLLRLREEVRRRVAGIQTVETMSLAELGAVLAEKGQAEPVAQVRAALERIDDELGFVGSEVTRDILVDEPPEPEAPVAPEPEPAFDVGAMQAFLDGAYVQTRERTRRLLERPDFTRHHDVPLIERRERVYDWLRILTSEGLGQLAFPGVTTERDAGHFFAAFETIATFDASLMTKFGVQFGLFGGSIYHLGTDEQRRRWLPAVASLELPGAFAMSELGHGSNVRDVETVARWIPADDEFEIHTPSDSARKEWIGNAALHGRMATVFAQLEVGDDAHGVHALLVPLRDAAGATHPGVRIEDCGPKMGLDGVDNGRIWFDRVRVPRANLLSRFGAVDADGSYSSPIPSPGRRFFTMLGTLVGGRVAVAAGGNSVARVALVHAVRYGARRRQFGPPGEPEIRILDYRMHQIRLMPLLARAYAYGFATEALVERLVRADPEEATETEALAAGVKALATWNTTATVQTCREACGGQGYLAVNRFADLKADSDIFATYEGDNVVLLQLVARGRLASFRAQIGDAKLLGVVRHLARQTATAVAELNPVIVRQRSDEHLRDPEFQLAAMRYRESRLVTSLARRLKHRIDEGVAPFDAFNECQDHAVAAARAYVSRWVLERFHEAVTRTGRRDLQAALTDLRDLFALAELHEDSGWFQQAGYVEDAKARAIRDLMTRLCGAVRTQAVPLVDAFAIPESALGPIGRGEISG